MLPEADYINMIFCPFNLYLFYCFEAAKEEAGIKNFCNIWKLCKVLKLN